MTRRSLLLAGLALALAACGKRGRLEAPPGEEASYSWPHFYPARRSVLPQGSEAAPPPLESDSSRPDGPAYAPDLLDPERGSVSVFGPAE